MFSFLGGIVETISRFFEGLASSSYLTVDYIFYVSMSLQLLLIIFFLIKSSYSYELRLDRSLDNLNRWLYYNQYLDETNLIEFNNRIKKAPKLLRYHWQQFMLYREKDPSFYMSATNCIEKPLHTSSFKSNIKNLITLCYTLAGITFVLNLGSFIGQSDISTILLNSLITPIAILVFSAFFTILLRSWQNANLAGLYQNFHLFTRYIDKAATTLPEYIDFEVLFTKDEIKRGIPVLNEFLEKRARQEQKELEEAMLNSVDHEEYDFTHLGLNGSQILERAMRETEIYLNQRQRVLSEIQQLESEIESAKRNYENNQKEFQRKMQTSKENVERLRKQQEESTNRIESNYIRKQQTDEIKKQEQLEKDYESVTLRFNQDINTLSSEIKTRREELEEKKKTVEESMHAEYETFSTKTYKELRNVAVAKEQDERKQLAEEKENYLSMLQQSNQLLAEKDIELKKLHSILQANNINLGDHGEFYDAKLRKEAKQRKQKLMDLPVSEEPVAPIQEVETHSPVVEELQVAQPVAQVTNETTQPEYDEFGGYYDAEGYYRYQNGTYYDPQGNFYDGNGGYYAPQGNYITAEKTETVVVEKQTTQTQPTQEEIKYDEFGGYYDAEGYYRYQNGTYYDPQGNFYDGNGGYYDPQGNYIKPTQETETAVVTETKQAQEILVKPEEIKSKEVKAQTPAVETEVVKEVAVEKKKRGRPKKEVVKEVEPVAVKQGRGRPKKVVISNEETVAEVKRGRGRPKKEVAQADTSKNVNNEKTEPKQIEEKKVLAKRGRPKKEDGESNEAKTRAKRGKSLKKKSPSSEVKSKRGRPKKEAIGDLTNKIKEINTQIALENENLKQQHEELRNQINSTLNEIDSNLPNVNDEDNNSSNN